ncbi:MAG: 3-oxoacyl-ACP synthase III family protein [Gammaproteobacteria bacterium]
MNVQFKDVSAYLPARQVANTDLENMGYMLEEDDAFFKGVLKRHWAAAHETSVFMGAQACLQVLAKQQIHPDEIDLIICSAIIGDEILPQPACGIQHAIGATRATAITLDTGCASFVSGLIYGSALIRANMYQKILLVSIANFAGRAQSKIKHPSAAVPGDGAAAMLICADDQAEDALLGWWEKSFGQYHGMLSIKAIDEHGHPKQPWESHQQIGFWFDRELVEIIKTNGRELVPLAIKHALINAGRSLAEQKLVLTHQPNTYLLNHWRAELGATPDQHFHTLAQYGNLFQASIPVTMATALAAGKLANGDMLSIGSFAFAGELAAAAVIRIG